MKLKAMKGALVTAAAIAAMSTSVMAMASGAVQLNDAELDQITAGRITSFALYVIAPTNKVVNYVDPVRMRLVCINCSEIDPALFPKTKSAYGFLFLDRDGVPLPMIRFGRSPVTIP